AFVEVRDSGPGPAPEIADRLFEPFVTGKSEGVGLGLAMARQAAESHGGRITWRREEDQTCFVIELPVESADTIAGPARSAIGLAPLARSANEGSPR
ncbi:MAG TPA: ATP-binding protein, partial [Gemmataceae bacterium]|nr:ATP-binding protein [Gemmataceae bacterium]